MLCFARAALRQINKILILQKNKSDQMIILGINAYHGDAAAALIKDGRIVAAVEEERFNRVKHCAGFPTESVRYCLQTAGIELGDVEHIGISRDPSAHLHKKIMFAATRAARQSKQWAVGGGQAAVATVGIGEQGKRETGSGEELSGIESGPSSGSNGGNGRGPGIFRQVKDRLNNAAKVRDLKDDLARALGASGNSFLAQFHSIEHHRAHLASSFYVSPFERAALLSIDGFGDFVSTMRAVGAGNSLKVLGQVEYPHSLGIVYTATTQFLGFPQYGDEGKVMGLAPYGRPRFIDQFQEIVRTEPDGRFRLNLDYFRRQRRRRDDLGSGLAGDWENLSGSMPVLGRHANKGTPTRS